MLDFALDINFLLFANYLVPSRFLQPLIPEPLLLDKVIRRFRYHSYISAVLVSYRGLRFGGNYIPLPAQQLNYRTYVQFYMKPSLYFLHSFITGVPSALLKRSPWPLSPLRADTVIESRDPEGWPGRLRVDGSAGEWPMALHLDSTRIPWQPIDPEVVADLADRDLGIFRHPTGAFFFLKVLHPPLKVQPALPLLVSLPPLPGLPLSFDERFHLSSAWISGPVEFKLNLPLSLTLDMMGYFIQRRLSPPASIPDLLT